MEDFPAPDGDERSLPDELFVWLSTGYQPYTHDLGSPFVPPDFTLGLPPIRDWPCWTGEPSCVLDPEDHPKPKCPVPADSTGASSMDEGKQKKKKKKHHRSRKTELKVTTRGQGANNLVWTHTGSAESSSSGLGSQSKGDSGLGSIPPKSHRGTDTEPRRKVPLRASPEVRREPAEVIEDAPLSNRGEDSGDQEMADAEEPNDEAGPAPKPGFVPNEVPEQVPPGDDPADVGNNGEPQEPQEPQEPLEPHLAVLQGFRTISQTLSAAYGAASSKIQKVIWKALSACTPEDRTFIWRASGTIRHWVDSVRPAMACSEKSTKDQSQLLVDAWQAGKDALDTVLSLIPEEEEPRLTPIFPRADLDPVLGIARCHTNLALWNIHAQLLDLVREHVPVAEQSGVFFNSILPITCSFQQQMDEMAINQVFPQSQVIPTLLGTHRGVLEGLSLMGPPSCSASWPASLVEWVTPVLGSPDGLGSSKTPAKPNVPTPGAGKGTPDSGKKSKPSIKQIARLYWKDLQRGKEDAEAC